MSSRQFMLEVFDVDAASDFRDSCSADDDDAGHINQSLLHLMI